MADRHHGLLLDSSEYFEYCLNIMTASEFQEGVAASGADAELLPLLPMGQLVAPVDVRLSADGKWLQDRVEAAGRSVTVPRDLLLRFTKLADAEASEVLAFAARYGMLRLCASHDLPRLHRHPQLRSVHPVCDGHSAIDEQNRRWFHESIEGWRYFARQAVFSLELATAIRGRRKPVPSDWRTKLLDGRRFEHFAQITRMRLIEGCEGDSALILALLEDESPSASASYPSAAKEREHAWEAVVGIAESWRVWADVQLITTVQRPGHARLSIGGIPLFSALAMQLTAALSSVGFALCGACGNSFQPKRMPRAGETSYCPACRKKGKPARAAIERHNERLQQARELVAAGVAFVEVAERTGLRPDTVRAHFGQKLNAAKTKARKVSDRRNDGKAR